MTQITLLLDKLREKGLKIATAESCTGGMIAAAITDIAGSSEVFERGYVTYSNQAKTEELGVAKEMIEKYGAVSAITAEHMARGALKNSKADVAVAVTGIAGPGGGTPEKPVGLVFIAVAYKGACKVTKNQLSGSRADIRREAVTRAVNQTLLVLNF